MKKEFELWTKEDDKILIDCHNQSKTLIDTNICLPKRTLNSISYRKNLLKLKPHYTEKNEDFFASANVINSSVAGFLAADGYIAKKIAEIKIGLSIKDIEILQQIKDITNSTAPIRTRHIKYKTKVNGQIGYKTSEICELIFNGANKWKNDLFNNWNIISGPKSLTLEPPIHLNDLNHQLAYINGLISGDGAIFLSSYKGRRMKQYSQRFSINLVGTEKILVWCRNIIQSVYPMDLDYIYKHGNIFKLAITGINAIKVFDILNRIDCIKLKRKWLNQEILSYITDTKLKFPHLFKTFEYNAELNNQLKSKELPQITNNSHSISPS